MFQSLSLVWYVITTNEMHLRSGRQYQCADKNMPVIPAGGVKTRSTSHIKPNYRTRDDTIRHFLHHRIQSVLVQRESNYIIYIIQFHRSHLITVKAKFSPFLFGAVQTFKIPNFKNKTLNNKTNNEKTFDIFSAEFRLCWKIFYHCSFSMLILTIARTRIARHVCLSFRALHVNKSDHMKKFHGHST